MQHLHVRTTVRAGRVLAADSAALTARMHTHNQPRLPQQHETTLTSE